MRLGASQNERKLFNDVSDGSLTKVLQKSCFFEFSAYNFREEIHR